MHSRVSMTTSTLSLGDSPEGEDEKPVSSATKEWVVRTKLVRLVNLFRKQKRQKLLQMRQLSVSTTSELRSDVPRVAVTPEPPQQGVATGITDTVSLSTRKADDERRASRNSVDRYGNEGTFIQSVTERLYINITNPLRNSLGRTVLFKLLPSIEPGIMIALNKLLEDEPGMAINSGYSLMLVFRLLSLALIIIPRVIFSVFFPNWSRQLAVWKVNNFVLFF